VGKKTPNQKISAAANDKKRGGKHMGERSTSEQNIHVIRERKSAKK